MSQQHGSVSQGRICSDKCTCCHTEIEVADQTFYLTQSQYTNIGPTSQSTDPIMPDAWQDSHRSTNCYWSDLTWKQIQEYQLLLVWLDLETDPGVPIVTGLTWPGNRSRSTNCYWSDLTWKQIHSESENQTQVCRFSKRTPLPQGQQGRTPSSISDRLITTGIVKLKILTGNVKF